MSDDFFAPPPFDAPQALVGLKRQLRDLRLAERGDAFELRGSTVVTLSVSDAAASGPAITARLAKRPARSPEWITHTLKQGPEVRRFVELVKQQLARWSDAE